MLKKVYKINYKEKTRNIVNVEMCKNKATANKQAKRKKEINQVMTLQDINTKLRYSNST